MKKIREKRTVSIMTYRDDYNRIQKPQIKQWEKDDKDMLRRGTYKGHFGLTFKSHGRRMLVTGTPTGKTNFAQWQQDNGANVSFEDASPSLLAAIEIKNQNRKNISKLTRMVKGKK